MSDTDNIREDRGQKLALALQPALQAYCDSLDQFCKVPAQEKINQILNAIVDLGNDVDRLAGANRVYAEEVGKLVQELARFKNAELSEADDGK